jgi:hypothetical protein
MTCAAKRDESSTINSIHSINLIATLHLMFQVEISVLKLLFAECHACSAHTEKVGNEFVKEELIIRRFLLIVFTCAL